MACRNWGKKKEKKKGNGQWCSWNCDFHNFFFSLPYNFDKPRFFFSLLHSRQLNCHNFFFSLSQFRQLHCHNSYYFLSFSNSSLIWAGCILGRNFGNYITKIQLFSLPLLHIISLSSLILFLRISATLLPKFASLFIFLNKLEQYS